MTGRVLAACIGNPDRGDDGAGALVAAHLARARPAGLAVRRYGDGVVGLLDDWAGFALVICVDAVAPMGVPGQIHVIDPVAVTETGWDDLPRLGPATSTHGLGLAETLRLARALALLPARLTLYGIEAESFAPGAPPSEAVQCAAAHVAAMIAAALAGESGQFVPLIGRAG